MSQKETLQIKRPILKQALNSKLKEINVLLRDKYTLQKNVGVLEGLSGIILFQFYYAQYTNNDTYADWGLESLQLLLKLINEGNCITTCASGIAGASWTLEHLNKSGFIDIDNDELLSGTEPLLKAIMFKEFSQGNYDFLHGGLGYAYYFLSRYQNTQNTSLKNDYKDVLIAVIIKLKDLSETDAYGVKWMSEIKSAEIII
jgi:lantibiotic modifying enzyme